MCPEGGSCQGFSNGWGWTIACPCFTRRLRLVYTPLFQDKSGRKNMDVILVPALKLLINVIDLYIWVVVIGVVLSWLTAFNVVNSSNRFVYIVGDFIYRFTEPPLRRIRGILPDLGGFDISPIILIFILIALQEVIVRIILKVG